jgi:hypothetical protein
MSTTFNEIGHAIPKWGPVDTSVEDALKVWLKTGDHRVQVSLLSAILFQLRDIKTVIQKPPLSDSDLLQRHSIYMRAWYNDDSRLVKRGLAQSKRVLSLCHNHTLPALCEAYRFDDNTIHFLARLHNETSGHDYIEYRNKLSASVSVLKRVKTLDDLHWLYGVGEVTIRKIKRFVSHADRRPE